MCDNHHHHDHHHHHDDGCCCESTSLPNNTVINESPNHQHHQEEASSGSSGNTNCCEHKDCCKHHHHEINYIEKDPLILNLFNKTDHIFCKLEELSFIDGEEEPMIKELHSILLQESIENIQDDLLELLSDFKYGRDKHFHSKLWILSRGYLFLAKFWSLQFINRDDDDEYNDDEYGGSSGEWLKKLRTTTFIPPHVNQEKLAKCIGYSFAWINVIYPKAIMEYEPYITVLIENGKLNIGDLWLEKNLQIVSFTSNTEGSMNIKRAPLHFNKRTFSQFRGEHFIIGDRHNETTMRKENYFILDIDVKEDPDVVGDAFDPKTIMPFPSNRFFKVILNFIGHNILANKNLLIEYHRILRYGGSLHFKTEHVNRESIEKIFDRKIEFEKNLWNTGFCDIVISQKYDNETTVYAPHYLLVEARKR